MADFETVARPYSRAIFELAAEQKELQYWSDVLQVCATVVADEAIVELVNSPSIKAPDLADLFISIVSKVNEAPEINPQVENMIKLLAENDRLQALAEIAVGYETYKQEVEGSIEVQVTTARKLTIKQQKEITKNMKERLGKEVTITSEIDQSLIAGAIIRAGDLVIDGSARGQLQKLTSHMNK